MKSIYERFIKRTFFFIFIVHFSTLSNAATYYVSNTGNDSNSGLTIDLSWQTLTKVNSSTFASGDQILFKRGDTFVGHLTVQRSNILFGAYGTGASPIISGFEPITGWVSQGNGIYRAKTTVSDSCNMVTVNGVNTPKGRYPKTGWLTFESFSGRTSITDNQLTNSPNWTGAEVVMKVDNWTIDRSLITNHTNNTITYTAGSTHTFEASAGYQYFFQNDLKTLTALGDWYCDGTYMYMYFGANNPSGYVVKAAKVNTIISLNSKNSISINDLTIEGGNVYGIFFLPCSGITISKCTIKDNGYTGIYGYGSSTIIIDGCNVNNNNGSGINVNATSTIVSNCEIDSSGAYAGMGSYNGSYTGSGLIVISVGGLIEYCHINNSGYNAITYGKSGFIVRYNIIDGCNFLSTDGGAIYTWLNDPTKIQSGIKVYNNIVLNSNANGLYCDNATNGIELYNNTIVSCGKFGFHSNDIFNVSIHHNTFYKSAIEGIDLQTTNGPSGYTHDDTITNNVIVNASLTNAVMYGYRNLGTDEIKHFTGISDFNTLIGDNNNTNDFYNMYTSPGYILTRYSFSSWKKLTSKEVNSIYTSMDLDKVDLVYNDTKEPKQILLSVPMADIEGTKYASKITLQPFSSIVLMKDNSPVTAPSSPTSVVATAGNANASVTFVAPVNNGGSVITGYTVTSIPSGGVDANAGSTSLTHTITGLTNGTSYTFTVKASNSAGSSVASVASNSVTPKAPVATSFQFTGPSSGNVNSASSNFTVTPNNPYTGTITITPSGTGSAGISAKVLTFSNSSAAQTFTITLTVAGSITLTATNNGTLTNPAQLTYTSNAVVPNAPTSVVATSGDASVSVTFAAPINNGGSAINGYTVTSNPAGGTDINAGSTSLTHTITGLVNGTYMFTVKATNSVGSSVPSVASNPIENVITKQGEIIPSHFTTVWQGLNGLNHMNINVVSAVLEDIPLSADDEIAVFSGSACVGSSKLTKSIVASDNSTFLTILASQNDGSGNGFIDNDTIVFKIWNNKTQKELLINSVVYRNDISSWKTNGRYSPGATTVVEIASYQVYTQSIELLKGYNMISTYVSAQNPNVTAVTKSLLDQGNLIKMQDETGNSFENWGTFGGWINQLGSLEKTEGYQIQVANNCTLQVTGRPIAMPFDISLKTGWNIVSFPRTDVVNAIHVVQGLIDQNKLVKVQDEAGNSIENWGLYGGWKNGIGNFTPGKAYKVKVSADAILTFQESYTKSAVVVVQSEETEYYHSSIEGNGTDHMNINITGLNSIGISVGDELAAFDGTVCVGTTKITEANLLSGSACLVSSSLTDDQDQNGFKVGDPIQISLWSKLSGDESKVNAEIVTGQMKYEKNASVLVKLKSATIITGVTHLDDAVKIDVFPNPCQGRVTVRFSEIPEANSRVEISDISGRKLISRVISGTSEEFNLDSFAPGLYLVRSILGTRENIHKLIVK